MPIINENQFFTPIIEFDVAPENQQALIDGIADEVERYFKSCIGFVSASFHASEDGRRVINYAQWHSKEDWVASGRVNDDEATAAILEVLKRYGATPLRGKVDFFRVARVINNEDNKS
jgi:Antibiotic biosynthesis monooxygenase